MNVEEYIIGSPQWLWPTVACSAVLVGAVIANYWRSGITLWRGCGMLLKIIAILLLSICLLEPLARGTRPKPQANVLPVLVDTSQSMAVRNSEESASDSKRIAALFKDTPAWLTRAEQLFDVRRYEFSDRMTQVDSFGAIAFDGVGSELNTSLGALRDRFANRPIAGCLLFTDGNATDATNLSLLEDTGFPIFPVRNPDAPAIRDLAIASVSVSETNFESSPVTISCTLRSNGLASEEVVVRLLDDEDALIEEQSIDFGDANESPPIQFRFRPQSSGISFYRLECVLASEPDALESNESNFEATLQNNVRLVTVDQKQGPFPILYVGGRPNWEFKYLRRALDEDAEVRLVGLLRIAKKQPKFVFGDFAVESSANPLFAGLGGSEEEAAEQLDEAVVIRLGVNDATELAGGFPEAADELFPFSAVIIDDVESSFFSQDQLLTLRKFVSVRGGSVLLLGGTEALDRGGYDQTPLGELAPVYLSNGIASEETFVQGPFRFELTREGMLEPFLRLRSTESAEEARLADAPPLKVLNRVGRVKPGAALLAEVRSTDGESLPAFAYQPFGRGKSAALMIGDLWRWSLRYEEVDALSSGDELEAKEDQPQLWRQMIRWLVSDVPRRVEARVDDRSRADSVRLVATIRNEDFSPQEDATVTFRLEQPDGSSLDFEAEPVLDRAGEYAVEFWPKLAGGYRATVVAKLADGSDGGTATTGWASSPGMSEFETLGSNSDLLERIAHSTGGKVLTYNQLDEFTSELSSRPAAVSERWEFPLWHRWWICGLALVCLCGEWGIRRWKGLA